MNSNVIHTLEPVFSSESKILILGTMPSPKSREYGFYYSHPQNRFWRVIAEVCGSKIPQTSAHKQRFLLENHIALWDVLQSCDIKGADDNSIKNPVANDLNVILDSVAIKKIYTTGMKATKLYQTYCFPKTKIPSIYLPSTSPANCRDCTFETLVEQYKVILEDISE